MNFKDRGHDILSCSALPRVRQCLGSFILSKGCPDDSSQAADDGQKVHDYISSFASGNPVPAEDGEGELHGLAWQMWGHAQKSAHQFFGQDTQLIWRSEKRHWMASAELEPILSGQFDLTCTVDGANEIILYDFKSGFLAGDVPSAEHNEQIDGMAAILNEETGKTILAAIVRPWSADQLCEMRSEWVRPWVQSVYEHIDPLEAGLKIGPHCRYCPAREYGKCPLHRDQLALVLKSEALEATMELMAPDNLARILRAAKPAESVIEAAQTEAKKRHANGQEIPGITFVKGNVKRSIKDSEAFSMRMLAEGVDLTAFQKTDVPLGASEKAWLKKKGMKADKAGKDAFSKTFHDLLEFSENAPSISFTE